MQIDVLPVVLPVPKGDGGQPHYVRRRKGTLEPYRPLEAYGSLFAEFAGVQTPQDVLTFIRQFGPLTAAGLNEANGELVEGVLANAAAMREVLAYGAGSRDEKLFVVASQTSVFAELEVTLAFDRTDNALALKFAPGSLLDAIWFQSVQKLLSGTVVRHCRQCGRPFEAGPGTRRRLDAKFCCEEHKILFHSHKRSVHKSR
jgi:hypothetical protein